MSAAPEIRPATAADAPALTRLLGGAFDADPVTGRRRSGAFAWYFRLALDLTLPSGHVFVTADGRGTASGRRRPAAPHFAHGGQWGGECAGGLRSTHPMGDP